MNQDEPYAIDCLKKKKWEEALLHLNNLLSPGNDEIDKEKLLVYLVMRSQCYAELCKYDLCIDDCRRMMALVPNEAPRNYYWYRARWRLTHCLMKTKRFHEAKEIVEPMIELCTDLTKQECCKMLERIEIGLNLSSRNDDPNKTSIVDKILSKEERSGLITLSKKQGNRDTNSDKYGCLFCNMSCNSVDELRVHCSSQFHQKTVMSDEGRDWKKRAPPRGFSSDTYNLCPNYQKSLIGICKNGDQCVDAHGVEELNEWKERFEYRKMRMEKSYESLLYGKSYSDLVLTKLSDSPNPESIIKEAIDGVEEEIDGNLTSIVEKKESNKKWVFKLRSRMLLKAVALLYDSHRNHFFLSRIKTFSDRIPKPLLNENPINNQEWTSRLNEESHGDTNFTNIIEISFSTKVYGTFRQTVIFDFGNEPYLMKHLCVDVVPVNDVEKMKEVHQELVLPSSERWEESNSVMIPFSSTGIQYEQSQRDGELLAKYFVPNGQKFTITQSILTDASITKNNYNFRMHELLNIEEMACYEQVSKFSVKANVNIVEKYQLMTITQGTKYSQSGELFAIVKLSENISEDSPGGRLVLNNCSTVLLSDGKKIRDGDNMSKHRVYEALIADKGKHVVYLRLSYQTVVDLKLKPDTSVTLEMQFQLNRIPFCEWHQAVDNVSNYGIIFPDVINIPKLPAVTDTEWTVEDERLNLKQREAIVAITAPQENPIPPVLIIGPFGTGKTFTLAQAIKRILQEKDTRILICTHSNSAADLYIKEYLHLYVKAGMKEATPLRIYYHKRWVSSVSEIVQQYCQIEVVNGNRVFKTPGYDDIIKYRVIVVTLNISSHLSSIGLPKGHFSHILLDEAAQAIECEAIMPLSLANERTRIVLAGDHMQLSPEIFSPFAKQKKFHISLLQRLYESYPTDFPCKIVLCENYRAHEAIVQYTSRLFYDDKLVSLGRQPKHEKFYPLTFFTALGEDVQDINSTGFYNNAEVYELVERVIELKNNWPSTWGKFNEQSIGIMTPYSDQVYRIRAELKRRKTTDISVERVLNVQGKQFRAVFLSTVRTRRTCITHELDTNDTSLYDYGFLSNKKLLNTAVTRAQSLVAAVGDPISLCSVGRCRKIWEDFLEICQRNDSIFGFTGADLKSILIAMELRDKYKLNPLAPEFVPRSMQMEPYLQFGSTPQQSYTVLRTVTNIRPKGVSNTAASVPYNQSQGLNMISANRIYTYDNVRYQIPQAMNTSGYSLSGQTYLPPSSLPATQIPTSQYVSSYLTTPTPAPSKWNQPTSNTTITLQAPPGFTSIPPPLPPTTVAANTNPSLVYPSSSSLVASPNVFTVYPLSQYIRTHPPPIYQMPTGSKAVINSAASSPVFSSGSGGVANQISAGTTMYSAPTTVIQSSVGNAPAGYKGNFVSSVGTSGSNYFNGAPSVNNYTNNSAYTSTLQTSTHSGYHSPNTPLTYPNSDPGHVPLSYDYKDLIPPGTSLEEVVRNTPLQVHWTSMLLEAKQIQRAQLFLNLIKEYSVPTTMYRNEYNINESYQVSRPVIHLNQRSTTVNNSIENIDPSLSSTTNISHLALVNNRQTSLYKRQSMMNDTVNNASPPIASPPQPTPVNGFGIGNTVHSNVWNYETNHQRNITTNSNQQSTSQLINTNINNVNAGGTNFGAMKNSANYGSSLLGGRHQSENTSNNAFDANSATAPLNSTWNYNFVIGPTFSNTSKEVTDSKSTKTYAAALKKQQNEQTSRKEKHSVNGNGVSSSLFHY